MISESRLKELWVMAIERIHKFSPNATIGQAKALADQETELYRRCSEAESALMVIIREYMKCDDSGNYPKEVLAIADKNPRIAWAIQRASYVHAGIACSPFSGGWKKFDESIDNDIPKRNGR